ncbi:MAG: FmdE family protein [Promethearchaeota archaeon]
MIINKLMEKAVNFHGHACPGLALGVLISKYILEHGNEFSIDEELVAVVENDNCSVDALQALLGTTFGKGNLVHLDYGKNNYSFYNRTNQKAIKLTLKRISFGERNLSKDDRIKKILESKPNDIFEIQKIEFKPPKMAEIHDSIICERCKEPTMSTRIKEFKNKKLCIPCYQELKK